MGANSRLLLAGHFPMIWNSRLNSVRAPSRFTQGGGGKWKLLSSAIGDASRARPIAVAILESTDAEAASAVDRRHLSEIKANRPRLTLVEVDESLHSFVLFGRPAVLPEPVIDFIAADESTQ